MIERIRRAFDPYIAMMVGTIAIAAILPAHGIGAMIAGFAANAGIVVLFFLYGTRLSPRAAWDGLRRWQLHLAVLLATFALFPLLGIGFAKIAPAGLPPALVTGLVFLCLLPSTVQSSIAFTSIARGNVSAALCAASASSLLGIFITPVLAGFVLNTQGVHLSFDVFRDILLQLLVPFFAGQALRGWIGGWVQAHKRVLGFTDRGAVLMIIYVAFSKGMVDHIWGQVGVSDLLILAAMLAMLLGIALTVTGYVGRHIMRLDREDEIVLQFCGSKKSLASGLPIASVLFNGPQLGLIVLPLMLFHQLQLIVCAVLARRYAERPIEEPPHSVVAV